MKLYFVLLGTITMWLIHISSSKIKQIPFGTTNIQLCLNLSVVAVGESIGPSVAQISHSGTFVKLFLVIIKSIKFLTFTEGSMLCTGFFWYGKKIKFTVASLD